MKLFLIISIILIGKSSSGQNLEENFFIPKYYFDSTLAFNWATSVEMEVLDNPIAMYREVRKENYVLIEKVTIDSSGTGNYFNIHYSQGDTTEFKSNFILTDSLLNYPIITGNFELVFFNLAPQNIKGETIILLRSGNKVFQCNGPSGLLEERLKQLPQFFKLYLELRKNIDGA